MSTAILTPRRAARSVSTFSVLLYALILIVAVAIAYPIISLLFYAFVSDGQLSLAAVQSALGIPVLGRAISNTLLLVLCATTGATVLGTVLAWLNERTNARMGWFSEAVPSIPLVVSPVAGTLGYVFMFSPEAGFVNSLLRHLPGSPVMDVYTGAGVILITTLYITPTIYVMVSSALRNIDSSLEEASFMSGVGPFRTLYKVVFPSLAPTIASSALLGLLTSIAMFTIPIIAGTRADFPVLSTLIYQQLSIEHPSRLPEAVVLGTFMLVAVQAALLLERWVSARGMHGGMSSRAKPAITTDLGPLRWVGRAFTAIFVVGATALPLAGLFLVSLERYWTADLTATQLSFDSYGRLFSNFSYFGTAFRNSFLLAVIGATLCMALALAVGLYLWRMRRGRGGRLITAITGLPASIPHTVMGVAILISYGTGLRLSGTLVILLLAYVLMYITQAMRAANSAYSMVGSDLWEASLMSGVGTWGSFRRVQLPLMFSGFLAGWVLLFVLMFDEVTASVFLASTNTPVIGSYLIDLWLNVGDYPSLAAAALVICIVNGAFITFVVGFSRFWNRRMKAEGGGVVKE